MWCINSVGSASHCTSKAVESEVRVQLRAATRLPKVTKYARFGLGPMIELVTTCAELFPSQNEQLRCKNCVVSHYHLVVQKHHIFPLHKGAEKNPECLLYKCLSQMIPGGYCYNFARPDIQSQIRSDNCHLALRHPFLCSSKMTYSNCIATILHNAISFRAPSTYQHIG
ncbi:hypothetical protein TNCV_4971361 [Trichonephila clavipes]|nr:hypothetical protein TNCV_4971361 [Trichonephila clavipes]